MFKKLLALLAVATVVALMALLFASYGHAQDDKPLTLEERIAKLEEAQKTTDQALDDQGSYLADMANHVNNLNSRLRVVETMNHLAGLQK